MASNMDLNSLVNKNQSIKIIPSIEQFLETSGFNTNLDANTLLWLARIKKTWATWKKSVSVKQDIEKFLLSSLEPYRVALAIVIKCEEYKDSKVVSLPYYIIEVLNGMSFRAALLPDDKLKLAAFQIAVQQRNQVFISLVIKTYKISTIKSVILPTIYEMISQGNHKQVAPIIVDLELATDIPVQEILFPLVLQDKTNMIYEYLGQCTAVIEPFLLFMDELLEKNFQMLPFVQNYIEKYKITGVKYDKFHHKPLGKFVAKLCAKFKYPLSNCKNLSKNRTFSGLRYLVYQKYLENNISPSVWEDLVRDTLEKSPHCHIEFIDFLAEYDKKEALKWAEHLNISKKYYPYLLKANSGVTAEQEESWDTEPSASQEFYKLTLNPEAIIIIDTVEKFKDFTTDLQFSPLLGIDCEWKPSFGATQQQVALIQIATKENVYLIDAISLNGQNCMSLWHQFQKTYLDNSEIIKIGFGLENDLKEMKSSIVGLSNIQIKGEGLLDLSMLWKSLLGLDLELPYNDDGGSLSALVKSCFNLPLQKSERCSNWELRPLRQSQIEYAALDAYVLIELYNFLQNVSREQGYNFDEICNDVMLEVKQKTKKEKVVDRLLESFDAEIKQVQAIKLLLDPKLSHLFPHLRYVGIDSVMSPPTMGWHDIVYLAISEERFILVTKMKFSPNQNYPQNYILKLDNSGVKGQLKQVIKYFNINIVKSDILSRCVYCNENKLTSLNTAEIENLNEKYKVKSNVGSNRNNYEDYDNCDEPDYGNFLSDDEDIPPTICCPNVQHCEVETSLGIAIDFNDFDSLYSSKKDAILCESCGKILWDGEEIVKTSIKYFNKILKDVSA